MPTVSAPTLIKLHNLLFATDFSPGAELLLSHALDLSRHYHAAVYTVHVLPLMPFVETPSLDPRKVKASASEQLAKLLSSVSLTDVTHKEFIEEGEISEVLSKLAREYAVDMIVVGCGGRHGFGKLLLGSVAEEVFRHAECPVLTFGPHSTRWNADVRLHHILFATDFGPESEHALPYAFSLAEENHARLTMVHVSPEPGAVVPLPEPVTVPVVERGDIATYSESRLRALIPEETQLWHEPEFRVLFGPPAELILGCARDDVDMIVLGVKRPVPLTKHLGQGVAYKLACEAPCPVLSVSARYHAR